MLICVCHDSINDSPLKLFVYSTSNGTKDGAVAFEIRFKTIFDGLGLVISCLGLNPSESWF